MGWGKGKGRKGGDGKGRSDYGNYGVRPSIDKNWARERVENARTATSKGTPRRDGGGQSDSRVPGGHTILLVQYSDKSSGKTYSEHDTVSRAMDDICQMYEQVIKMDGGRAQAKYTVEDLWHFVERLEDIACMVFDAKALYRAVSWVSQDQCVFSGSVIDNIRYGMPSATEEEVLQVMREADLYEDVMKKPQGVATAASELSGGQKQRLSIARALLRDPKILLLDEATSALDTVSERKVQKALEKLMKGRTVIAIAHRLSTIMNADLILVMEAGKVIEQGKHNELLKKSGGKYANLVQQQLAIEDKKEDTSTDPKVVEECAAQLQQLREKVPKELAEEVEQACVALKNAAATLREEKKKLAMKERSLLGTTSKWKTAGASVRHAVRAIALMRSSSEAAAQGHRPAAPQLQRRLSAGAEDVDRALQELDEGDSPKANETSS